MAYDHGLLWLIGSVAWTILLVPVLVLVQLGCSVVAGVLLRLEPTSITFGCGPALKQWRVGRTHLVLGSHPRVGVVSLVPRTTRAVLLRVTTPYAVRAAIPPLAFVAATTGLVGSAIVGRDDPLPLYGLAGAAVVATITTLRRPWGEVPTVWRALRRPGEQRAQTIAIASSEWFGQVWDGVRPAQEAYPEAVLFARSIVMSDLQHGIRTRLTQFGRFGTANALLLADRPVDALVLSSEIDPSDAWWTWLRACVELDAVVGIVESSQGHPLVDGDAEESAEMRQRIRDLTADVVRGLKDPRDPLLHGAYATLALVEGSPALAEEFARRALSEVARSSVVRRHGLLTLAAALRAQDRDAEAAAPLREARDLDPQSPRPDWVESFRWPVVEGPLDPAGLLALAVTGPAPSMGDGGTL